MIELRKSRKLKLIEIVEEGKEEGKEEIVEDWGIIGKGNESERDNKGWKIEVDERMESNVGKEKNIVKDIEELRIMVMIGIEEKDIKLIVVRKIVKSSKDGKEVNMRMVDMLGEVIKESSVEKEESIGGWKKEERGMRKDKEDMVEESKEERRLKKEMDEENKIREKRIILVEKKREIVMVGKWKDEVIELSKMKELIKKDRIIEEKVDKDEMDVEIEEEERKVEEGWKMIDMGRFKSEVIERKNKEEVIGKEWEDRESSMEIEKIIRIKLRKIGIERRIGRKNNVGIDKE